MQHMTKDAAPAEAALRARISSGNNLEDHDDDNRHDGCRHNERQNRTQHCLAPAEVRIVAKDRPTGAVSFLIRRAVSRSRAGAELLQAPLDVFLAAQPGYLGDCKPGEFSHSFKCDAVSAWLAFFNMPSRSGPGGKRSAFSRAFSVNQTNRSLRDNDVKRRLIDMARSIPLEGAGACSTLGHR
jgi:hypothetical protein